MRPPPLTSLAAGVTVTTVLLLLSSDLGGVSTTLSALLPPLDDNPPVYEAALPSCNWSVASTRGVAWLPPAAYAPAIHLRNLSSGVGGAIAPSNSTLLRLTLAEPGDGCPPGPLDWLSQRAVVAALADRHVVWFGDSTSRYQYLNLVRFLHTGYWTGDLPNLEAHNQWSPHWEEYFAGACAFFEGHLACDATPPENAVNRRSEAYYYRHRGRRLRLTFVFYRGPRPNGLNNITFHPPAAVNAWCDSSAASGTAASSNHPLGGAALTPRAASSALSAAAEDIRMVGQAASSIPVAPLPVPPPLEHGDPCYPTPCTKGGCDGGATDKLLYFPSFETDRAAAFLKADTVILSNSMHSYVSKGGKDNREANWVVGQVERLVAALGRGNVVWRSNPMLRSGFSVMNDPPLLLERMRHAGAVIHDVTPLTYPLEADSTPLEKVREARSPYWNDGWHPSRFVYRGLNEALLAVLLPALPPTPTVPRRLWGE